MQLDLYHSHCKSAHILGFHEQDGGGVKNEMTKGSSMFLYHQLLLSGITVATVQPVGPTHIFNHLQGMLYMPGVFRPSSSITGQKKLGISLGGVRDLST